MFFLFSLETLLLVVAVLVLLRYYIYKKWSVLKDLNIPHDPPSIFTLGNLGATMKDPDAIFLRDLELKKKFGHCYGHYLGLSPRIVIGDPMILKQVYIKEFPNFKERQKLFCKSNGKELNSGLFQTHGEQWKRLRHSLTPTFSTSKLKAMSPIIENCVGKMIANLHKAIQEKNGRFDAKTTFNNLSMDIICSAAFSTDVHSQDLTNKKPSKIVEMAQKLFQVQLFAHPFIFLFMMFPSTEEIAEKLDYSVFGKDVIQFFARLVDRLILNKKENEKNKRTDLMQAMLELEVSEEEVKKGVTKGLTRREIVGNAILMILAGYETTGNSMIFLAYNLAQHKDVQEKLREEIETTVEKYGELNYEAVNSMKYLVMCINESMRLYLPVPRNSRLGDKDITINGIHIPAGVNIEVPIYGMALDEEYWDEPFKFKPERMEDMTKIDPLVFQPFGAGPRICIGQRFALLEIKYAFCKLLQNFSLDVCEDTPKPRLEITFKASMQPKKDIYLKVVPRN